MPRPEPLTRRARLSALRHLPHLFADVWHTGPALLVAALGCRLVRAVLPVAALYVGKLIIDEVVHETRLPAPGAGAAQDWLASGRLTPLLLLLALEFALGVGSDLLGRAASLADGLLAELHANRVSVLLMRHTAGLDLKHFESADQQDRLERARRAAVGRSTLLSQAFGQAQGVLTVLSLAAGLAAYAPWLLLLLGLAVVPAFLGEAAFNAEAYRLAHARTPERRELDYVRYIGASPESAKEVKLFGLGDFLVERFALLSDGIYRANRGLAWRRAGWGALLSTLGSLAYYGCYAVIAWSTVTGRFTIGDLSFLAGSFLRLRGLLEDLLLGLSQTAGQALYLEDLYGFLEARPEIVSPPGALPFPVPLREGFAFEDVGFRYPGTDRWAVRHLSFSLRAGEVLALVGENGAGKTTIVKLLTRLYDPDEGRVTLDGRDLRDYDLGALRAGIGVIFQDFVRYHFTAGENVAVGRIEARGDRVRIEDAATRGLADPMIRRLPEGYDQPLGRRFTRGVDLSGGEWQKLALARGYMREAGVMVLDEPTAALDARAEAEVFERFKALSQGRTALLISHRFSTVRMADRILVLDGGRVLEQGSHAELVARGGRYAELFDLQAAGYR